MPNLPGLVDLTPVFLVLATLGGSAYSTSGALQWLRNIFLDRLTATMPDAQRNDILRGLLFVLNVAVILGLALVMHFPFSTNLLGSVLLGALNATGAAHALYVNVQKPASQRYGTPPASSPVVEAPVAVDTSASVASAAADGSSPLPLAQ